eukprot:14270580-Alexandrium_andersonii.AAC.1
MQANSTLTSFQRQLIHGSAQEIKSSRASDASFIKDRPMRSNACLKLAQHFLISYVSRGGLRRNQWQHQGQRKGEWGGQGCGRGELGVKLYKRAGRLPR